MSRSSCVIVSFLPSDWNPLYSDIIISIGYPIIKFYRQTPQLTSGAFNIGGTNSSGQVPGVIHKTSTTFFIYYHKVPLLVGNFGLIDNDTPKEAYVKPSWADPSSELQLVFSDEFNTDGRTFYPGDDPYWEAVDLHYWVRRMKWFDWYPIQTLPIQSTNNLEWNDPEAVTTVNGSLVITLSQKETHGLNYEGGTFFWTPSGSCIYFSSGMVSTW